jgi:5-methylcytosine-specific restriction protein A
VPYAPKKPCTEPGCPNLTNGGPCPKHKRKRYRKPRPNAAQRGYDHKWQKARAAYLQEHPVCTDPYGFHEGRPVAATVVDHIECDEEIFADFWDFNVYVEESLECLNAKVIGDNQKS